MEKILTIGIPAYNMEEFLPRCLDSVVAAKNIDKLDIIVVNDGSKDHTSEIAHSYEERYPSSIRVIDKPNGGWGTAINLSIREAKGKYYKSLDSDDWFDTENLDRFVNELEKIDVDIVHTDFNEVYVSEEIIERKVGGRDGYVVSFADHLKTAGGQPIHAVSYKTSFLHKIKFEVLPKFYADLDYILTPLKDAKTICIFHLNLYQYYLGREGQSVSVEGYNKHFEDFIAVSKKLIAQNNQFKEASPEIYNLYLSNIFSQSVNCYRLLMMNKFQHRNPESKKILKEYDKFLKINSKELYNMVGKKKAFKFLPYIKLWRVTGLNIFALCGV